MYFFHQMERNLIIWRSDHAPLFLLPGYFAPFIVLQEVTLFVFSYIE